MSGAYTGGMAIVDSIPLEIIVLLSQSPFTNSWRPCHEWMYGCNTVVGSKNLLQFNGFSEGLEFYTKSLKKRIHIFWIF